MEKMKVTRPLTPAEIDKLFEKLPRFVRAFYPTPFHRLNNLSADYGCEIFAKREDMSGPSNFGGNKVRKLELIIADALEKGYDTMISMGAYQTNSAMELCQYCVLANIKPIIYLADIHNVGIPQNPDEIEGNMRLMKMMGAELHFIPQDPDVEGSYFMPLWNKTYRLMDEQKAELETQGHKVLCVPSGCASDVAMPSFVQTFKEIMEQSEAMGVKLTHIYHTSGTGGSLPGLILGKYLMGSDVDIHSICCCSNSKDDDLCNAKEIVRRVNVACDALGVEAPDEAWTYAQVHYDENYYGEDYGDPTEAATAAMLQLASREAMFTDSVYTGKGISGMLDHIKSGKIPKASKVCFIHTGGTGALFAEEGLTGKITR